MEDAAGHLVGVEVKASATATSGDFKGLRALQEIAGKRFMCGVLLYTGIEAVAVGADLFALPLAVPKASEPFKNGYSKTVI